MTPASGRVFIIGAGPGDPGLITMRGARLLAQADVVVYDRAAEPLLRWAALDAERIEAGAPAERTSRRTRSRCCWPKRFAMATRWRA